MNVSHFCQNRIQVFSPIALTLPPQAFAEMTSTDCPTHELVIQTGQGIEGFLSKMTVHSRRSVFKRLDNWPQLETTLRADCTVLLAQRSDGTALQSASYLPVSEFVPVPSGAFLDRAGLIDTGK
jgi:hypothetical protein